MINNVVQYQNLIIFVRKKQPQNMCQKPRGLNLYRDCPSIEFIQRHSIYICCVKVVDRSHPPNAPKSWECVSNILQTTQNHNLWRGFSVESVAKVMTKRLYEGSTKSETLGFLISRFRPYKPFGLRDFEYFFAKKMFKKGFSKKRD